MEEFWFFWLSLIVLSFFFRSERRKKAYRKERREEIQLQDALVRNELRGIQEAEMPLTEEEAKELEFNKEAEKQRNRDIAELRKQGFDDKMIAVILPTINNGQ